MTVSTIPGKGFSTWVANFEQTSLGKIVASFVRAFIGVYIAVFGASILGLENTFVNNGFTTGKDAVIALVLATLGAAFTAGLKAAQNSLETKALKKAGLKKALIQQ